MKKEEKARKRRYDILDAIAQVSMEEFSYLDVKPFLKDIKAREIRMLYLSQGVVLGLKKLSAI